MDNYLKAAGLVLVAVVLCLILSGQNKSISAVLAICACCMICITAATYLKPVLEFFDELQAVGNLNTDLLTILVKAVGIGIITEITVLICSDSGNAALGKALQILSTALILWLSIPLFNKLLELVRELLTNL